MGYLENRFFWDAVNALSERSYSSSEEIEFVLKELTPYIGIDTITTLDEYISRILEYSQVSDLIEV